MAKHRAFEEVVADEHATGLGTADEPFAHLDFMGYAVGLAEFPWLEALAALDAGDQVPLQELFLGGQVPPDAQMAVWVGEALARHQIKKKRGGQATPAYAITWAQLRLLLAKRRVGTLVAGGASVREAVAAVAREQDIPEPTLFSAQTGHHGGAYRSRARRKTGR